MINRLKKSIKHRLLTEVSDKNPLTYLKIYDVDEYLPVAISIIYLHTRVKKGTNKTIYIAETISAIGHGIRNFFKLKKDSSLAAKTGAFILYSFEEMGMIEVFLGQSSNGNNGYVVKILNDEAISTLWSKLEIKNIEKLPSEKPHEPWTKARNSKGAQLVKTGNREVLDSLTPETHPMIFNVINRKLNVGWKINEEVYNLHLWALRNKTEAFSDIWEQQNPEARTTKLREAKAIGNIAKRFLGKTFYHAYYADFRGRIYPSSAYLHEQGTDLARGMLLRADSKEIGKEGFEWLLISIASTWGGDVGRADKAKSDKIPLQDRIEWVLANEDMFLAFAEEPKKNQDWMQADKPWQHIAACYELLRFRRWQCKLYEEIGIEAFNRYDFKSHIEVFIDGSNNGSQHLSALTRDEITAPHVNLVPADLPGDLYKYIAEYVWKDLEEQYEKMAPFEKVACEEFIDKIIELKKRINEAETKSPERKALVEEIQQEKLENVFLMNKSCVVYWMRVKDLKERRKICKR